MERSIGAEAVLDETWTTPWLDEGVFPYWPEAASIGDLDIFLGWLAIQDSQRAALVLSHAREFEKVHRLITGELIRTRRQEETLQDPPRRLSSSNGVGEVVSGPSTAVNGTFRRQRGRGSSGTNAQGGRSQSAGTLHSTRSREAAAARALANSGARRSFEVVPNATLSWPPAASTRNARGRRRSAQDTITTPAPSKPSRRTLAPRTAAGTRAWQAPSTPSAPATRSSLIAPKPRRVTRRWSAYDAGFSMDTSGSGSSGGGSGAGSRDLDSEDASVPTVRGGAMSGQQTRGKMASAAAAAAAAGRAASVRQAAAVAAAAAAAEELPVPVNARQGRRDNSFFSPGYSGAASNVFVAERLPFRSSLIVSSRDRDRGNGYPPPRPQDIRPTRSGIGDGEGNGAATFGRHSLRDDGGPSAHGLSGRAEAERPMPTPANGRSSPTSELSAHVSSSIVASTSAIARARRRSSDRRVRIERSRTRLADVDEESELVAEDGRLNDSVKMRQESPDEVQEAQDDQNNVLCMRDPVSLREFWFDPKTRAAEWEGGGAIEDTGGGGGLGLLSQEERDKLRRKFERRQRRSRRSGGVSAMTAVGSHGHGLREHLLRKLTLEADHIASGGDPAVGGAAGVKRGAIPTAFFADSPTK